MLSAGALDRKLKLLRSTTTTNAMNEDVEAWLELGEVWAAKQDVRDAERVQAAAVGASVTTRFQVRWSSLTRTLTTADRVQLGDRVYDIVALKELDRREGIEITAKARAVDVLP